MTVAEEFRTEGRLAGFQAGLKLGEQKGLKLGEQKGLELGEQKGLKLGEQLGKQKGLELGEQKGRAKRDREIVQNLYHQGFATEVILKVTGLSPDQLRSIMKGQD